jgi:hypothetical protein
VRVTFADGTSARVTPPEGAYLSVRRGTGRQAVTAMGGGPSVLGGLDAAVARID